jgi:hypothetical protein
LSNVSQAAGAFLGRALLPLDPSHNHSALINISEPAIARHLKNKSQAMAVASLMMTASSTFWGVLFLVGTLLYLARTRTRGGLNSIPGPFVASLTNIWRLCDVLRGSHHETLIKLHRNYKSDAVRIGPNVVSIADPEAVRTIYGLKQGFDKVRVDREDKQWMTVKEVLTHDTGPVQLL